MSELILVFGKATIVLIIGAVCALSLMKAAAALRHAVWSATLTGLLVLPVTMLFMPAWRVPVIPAANAAARGTLAYELASTSATSSTSSSVVDIPAPAVQAPLTQRTLGQAGVTPASSASASIQTASGATKRETPKRTLIAYIYLAWLVGTISIFGRLLLGRIALALVARRAQEMTADWQQALEAARHSLGIRTHVRVLRTGAVATPVTFGLWRPVIVVPLEADKWDVGRRDVVLSHELAHIARRDALTQVIAMVACAAYWPHPAAWYAARQLRIESERACDDVVLLHGADATDYADHLLDVARSASRSRRMSSLAIAMARPSHFEGRLLAILDDTRKRALPRYRIAAITICLCVIVASLGAFVPSARRTLQKPKPAPTAKPEQSKAKQTEQQAVTSFETFETSTLPPQATKVLSMPLRIDGFLMVDVAPASAMPRIAIVGTDSSRLSVFATDPASWAFIGHGISIDSLNGGAYVHVNTTRRAFIEVHIPSRIRTVNIDHARADVVVSNVLSILGVQLEAGSVTLMNVGGDATFHTDSGDVAVSNSSLDGTVETRNGTARASATRGLVRVIGRPVGAATGNTENVRAAEIALENKRRGGLIQVDGTDFLVREAALRVDRDGDLDESLDLPNGAWLTSRGNIDVVSSKGPLFAKTTSGRIRILSTQDNTYAVTGRGDVSVSFPRNTFSRDVFIESGAGNVDLVLPANINAVFDVETSYGITGPPVSIEGPAALKMDAEWEGTGIDRKKVIHATGKLGDGYVHIHIRTRAGNVTIH